MPPNCEANRPLRCWAFMTKRMPRSTATPSRPPGSPRRGYGLRPSPPDQGFRSLRSVHPWLPSVAPSVLQSRGPRRLGPPYEKPASLPVGDLLEVQLDDPGVVLAVLRFQVL